MSTYRVFLGAPSLADNQNDPKSYSWRTLSSSSSSKTSSRALSRKSTGIISPHDSSSKESAVDISRSSLSGAGLARSASTSAVFPFALASLEAASQRISMIYKDVVFRDMAEEESFIEEDASAAQLALTVNEDDSSDGNELQVPTQDADNSRGGEEEEKEVEVSVFRGVEQTTVYSWPPTAEEGSSGEGDTSGSKAEGRSLAAPSFLLASDSSESSHSPLQTQDRGEDETQFESRSFGTHSSSSSIAQFPSFHFNLHTLSSLSGLTTQVSNARTKLTRKVNLLLAILEVEGPETMTIKKGVDAGKEVSILKMILGDEERDVCKLTAWRDIADDWGGNGTMIGVKRGDVVYIENVMATAEPATSITLSASPHLKSTLTICYRTMPYTHEDGRMRPDLRLGISEPCVRRVADVVRWFEHMAGLA